MREEKDSCVRRGKENGTIDKQNLCSYNIIIATVGIVDTKREEIKQTLSLEFNLAQEA